jgi:hypothetical protein
MRGIVGLLVSLALMLAFASVAMAGPRSEQYGDKVTTVTKTKNVSGTLGATASAKSPTVVKAATGALPFTGLQLGIAVIAGTALLGSGLVVRRVARQRDNS